MPRKPPDRPPPGIDKDWPDYGVYCGEWCIGRIYQTRGGPEAYKWFWSLAVILRWPAQIG